MVRPSSKYYEWLEVSTSCLATALHLPALGSILKTQGDLEAALREFRAELVNNPAQVAADQQIAEIEARLRK